MIQLRGSLSRVAELNGVLGSWFWPVPALVVAGNGTSRWKLRFSVSLRFNEKLEEQTKQNKNLPNYPPSKMKI